MAAPAAGADGSAGWPAYLDALEAAVQEVRSALDTGRAPLLPALVPPAGPATPATRGRRDALLTDLQQAIDRLAARRDDVAARLSALAPPRTRTGGRLDVGATLDLLG
jgi:hypothetical protein